MSVALEKISRHICKIEEHLLAISDDDCSR